MHIRILRTASGSVTVVMLFMRPPQRARSSTSFANTLLHAIAIDSPSSNLRDTNVHALRHATPSEIGLDGARLRGLLEFVLQNPAEKEWCEDYAAFKSLKLRQHFGSHADVAMVGPFTPPGDPDLLVLRGGAIALEHGDTTFVCEIASATKSFISTLAGVAVGEGRIRDVHASVFDDVHLDLLSSARHRSITWHHLLQQTSEWEGTLFGKRWDGHDGRRFGDTLREPGTFFEYNDVRVNLLARCLLEVFGEPLPDVLRRKVMDPMGATDTWRWHGYATSDVDVAGRPMRSVSGGAHWGGGLWMCSRDLARYGLLYLRDGRWENHQILPPGWVEQTWTSCPRNYMYGYGWWLQHDAAGTKVSFAAHGGGTHACFVIPRHDLLVVVRWLADRAWIPFLNLSLGLVSDAPVLGPVVIDFKRVNAEQA